MENQTTSPKDVFLHLFSIFALYIAAGAFVSLIFDYINIYLPDALNPYEAQGAYGCAGLHIFGVFAELAPRLGADCAVLAMLIEDEAAQ